LRGELAFAGSDLFLFVGLARGQAGGGPVLKAADVGRFDALLVQRGGHGAGATAAAAVEDHLLTLMLCEKFFPELFVAVEIALGEQRGGRGNAGVSPFESFATVDEHGLALGDEFRGVLRGDLGRFRSEGTGHEGEQQREGGEDFFHGRG